MSTKELTQEAMALPLAERVTLAQSLWQSIEGQTTESVADEEKWRSRRPADGMTNCHRAKQSVARTSR